MTDMTDAELRDIYTRSLTSRAPSRAGCPSPEALEALIAQTGSEASRLATLDHVMSCAACKEEFELLRAIHAAERVNAGVARSARPRRSVAPWLAAAVVVIAAGALTLAQLQRSGSNPTRGASSSDIALVGTVSGSLVWHAIPDAVRYDVEIVDASGSTIFHARVADTTAALPSTLPSSPVSWWVRATLRDGSERRSAIVPLR
jgi:hypothetical protein